MPHGASALLSRNVGRGETTLKTLPEAVQRVRCEYLEMPGLRLKPDQVHRLCGIEAKICQMVLDVLVNEHFLCVKPDGHYVRVTEGPVSRPQYEKAEIRTAPRSKQAS
jgi:hypothetical protein